MNTCVLAWRARRRGGAEQRGKPARPSRALLTWHFWIILKFYYDLTRKKFNLRQIIR